MASTVINFTFSCRCAARSYFRPPSCVDSVHVGFGRHPVQRRIAIARANDLDIQVFRFTLGIPGFDDANIPRVIGAVGAVLLTLNHVLTAQPVPDTQVLLHKRFFQTPLTVSAGFSG